MTARNDKSRKSNPFEVENNIIREPGKPPLVEVGGKMLAYLCVERLKDTGIQIGDMPLNGITVYQENGTPVNIEDIFAREKYTVLVGACLTCGAFIESFPGVEALERDYRDKGIQFYYVYRSLSHPERNDYIDPFTIDERLLHIAESKKQLKVKIPYIADNMNNELRLGYGDIPNPAFIFDHEGRVVYMLAWADPELLRNVMAELAGPVDEPTQPADLDINHDYRLRREQGDKTVPPIETPDKLFPLKIEPQDSEHPYYAKLTAEVESEVLEGKTGKLYLGFRMDPMYAVSWNNLAEPVQVTLETADGLEISSSQLSGTKPDVIKDKSQRQFLVEIHRIDNLQDPFTVRIHYYACGDDNTWCTPILQEYRVFFVRRKPAGMHDTRLWNALKKTFNHAWGDHWNHRFDV